MFFQETTPDTSGYMIAGYAVAFIVMALYVVSIYLRNRNLKQDMTILEEIEKSAESVQPASVRQPGKNQAKPAGSQPARAGTRKTRKNY